MKRSLFASPLGALLTAALVMTPAIGCKDSGTGGGDATGGDAGGGSGGDGNEAGAGGNAQGGNGGSAAGTGGSASGGSSAGGAAAGSGGATAGSGGATAGSGGAAGKGGAAGGGGSAGGSGGQAGAAAAPMACILPLGDSITQGQLDTGTGTYWFSYRYPLWKKIKDTGYTVNFVGSTRLHNNQPAAGGIQPVYPDPAFDRDHEGHWGWRADQVLAQLSGWIAGYTPGIVLLHLGSNDAATADPATVTIDDLRKIIAALRVKNPGVVVLLAQILPYNGNAQRAPRAVAMNALIPALATELDRPASRVVVVDQYTGFDDTTMTHDTLHPNDLGEKFMTDRWFAALEPFLKIALPCPDAN